MSWISNWMWSSLKSSLDSRERWVIHSFISSWWRRVWGRVVRSLGRHFLGAGYKPCVIRKNWHLPADCRSRENELVSGGVAFLQQVLNAEKAKVGRAQLGWREAWPWRGAIAHSGPGGPGSCWGCLLIPWSGCCKQWIGSPVCVGWVLFFKNCIS